MNFNSLLSRLALTGVLAFAAGLVLNVAALAFFAFAASVLVLLIGAADYGSRRNYGAARVTLAPAVRRSERIPLAA